ncbi:MAG: alpha/beta hydrolase [Dehalococcoidia bacterium]|nr:alpha/beta hydrolase [Dehalococcoidia bacterium]
MTTIEELAGLPAIVDGPRRARRTLVLAHGAGAGMEHAFMERVATGVAAEGIRVVRFEFPYMAARREGQRRGPDREPVLRASWAGVIASLGKPERLVIGGKSMGGRYASMVADEEGVAGVVCLGYPFHPPGQPDRLRTAHLEVMRTPTLILQGERDSMGTSAEVEGYRLSSAVRVQWLEDGDHSLKPRKASGHTEQGHLETAVRATVAFVRERISG